MHDLELNDSDLKSKVVELTTVSNKQTLVDPSIEWQDVVDSHDQVVGVLPRKIIWDEGIQGHTRVSSIFIKDQEGFVLVPIRSQQKSYIPGGYDFSCGENLFSGEDYDSGAIRGLHEELGLEISNLGQGIKLSPNPAIGIFCFMKLYFITVENRSDVNKFNPEEVEHLEWHKTQDIVKLINDNPELFKRDYKAIFLSHLDKLQ